MTKLPSSELERKLLLIKTYLLFITTDTAVLMILGRKSGVFIPWPDFCRSGVHDYVPIMN
jgi:hypothetical protein